jgi:hypothetical protein
MLREIEPDHWHTFLDEFSERNRRRDAQLQISGRYQYTGVRPIILLLRRFGCPHHLH